MLLLIASLAAELHCCVGLNVTLLLVVLHCFLLRCCIALVLVAALVFYFGLAWFV